MSRIGRKEITIPNGVQIKIDGNSITVKGSNSELKSSLHDKVKLDLVGEVLTVSVNSNDTKLKKIHGTTRTQINNMVLGVTTGFEKCLEMKGVGYKVQVKGTDLNFSLGYSHPIVFRLPEGISVATESPTVLKIFGANKCLVGQVAADIKSLRPPEPYKGSGIMYRGEKIIRKEGKTGKK